jgi:hypothetical protein
MPRKHKRTNKTKPKLSNLGAHVLSRDTGFVAAEIVLYQNGRSKLTVHFIDWKSLTVVQTVSAEK